MSENRKAERKTFTSLGQLYIAGELLDFISYDISVTGILVEILPGMFLTSAEDFENLLKENCTTQFFVKDLMFTGEAEVVRVCKQNDSIMLGLEFRDVIYNAKRLWHRRRYYRKPKGVSGVMIINDDRKVFFESIDISMGGVMLQLMDEPTDAADGVKVAGVGLIAGSLKVGQVVKILMKELNIKAIAEIVWIGNESTTRMGLKYLQVDDAVMSFDH